MALSDVINAVLPVNALQRKLIGAAVVLVSVGLVVGLIHHAGVRSGEAHVQAKWDTAIDLQKKQLIALKADLTHREDLHRQETARITDQLHKTEADHETTLAALHAAAPQRLLDAERRATAYGAQADTGPAACRDLAGHAAELDRALEEGRGLVVEFGSTVRLREDQLRALGAVITNDRKLLGGLK